jgi:transcriptional regulator of acetoin/glycerol metabolism
MALAPHGLGDGADDPARAARTRTDEHLAPDARDALPAYPWPGNRRELAHVMESVALLPEARAGGADLLGLPAAPPEEGRDSGPSGAFTPEESTRDRLLETVNETNWTISRTAQRLGIARATLRARIERYGLRPGVDAPPLHQRTRRPAVREPAGSVQSGTRPERPPR